MGISFPRVEEVAAGQRVSARHMQQLSRAICARILSGLGDGPFRFAFAWISAMRQARNPSGPVFPTAAEFQKLWQHFRPTERQWPEVDPGLPEGINLATTMGSYVFGLGAADVDPEDVRLTDPGAGGVPVEAATTPEQMWELGKRQRGAYDPTSGALAAPAYQAAIEHFSLTQSPLSPHGNTYGGWFPTPYYQGDCEDGTADRPPSPNYEIKFTHLKTGEVRTYPGTCPENPAHVARVIPWPLGYYVVLWSGAVEYLSRQEWIEGPYSGGRRLMKAESGLISRVANRFAGEFRGEVERHQRELAGKASPLGTSFDFQTFLTSQYLLAPAIGRELGEGLVAATYPARSVSGAPRYAPGTRMGSAFSPRAGFVIAAFFARAKALVGSAVVELREGARVLGRVTLTQAQPSAIAVLAVPAKGSVQWVLPDGATTGTTGGIWCEAAELLEYRPLNHDLMLVCRLGGARAAGIDGTDGSGLSEEDARGIWTAYRQGGCIPRRRPDQWLPGSLAAINTNAVFDLFRRWSRSCRILPRQQLRGYAVEGGKSILWLDPKAMGLSDGPDSLEGITDAIAHKAPPGGWSNRWCLFAEFARYSNSASSIWKPEALADWVAMTDRCVHWTPIIPGLPNHLAQHFNLASGYSAKRSLAPEVASGYRYATGVNAGATEKFFRSCRIYEPPVEIESAKPVTVDGVKLVKVTLTGRLHHHHSLAPAEISRDVSTWDAADLTAEAADYRTAEIALREYLFQQANPSYQCEYSGPGNAAANSDILLGTDIPHGACYPNLFLVQLPAEPYLDENDRNDSHDTPMSHEQMSHIELWLRVLSEGCVDGKATTQYGCEAGIDFVFDFRWETLCYQVLGTPWLTTLPTQTTDDLDEADVREDAPMGFGPLPTAYTAAEVFNQFAKVTNALTDYRVMLPYKLEARNWTGSRTFSVTNVQTAAGDPVNCPGDCNPGFVWRGDPGDVEATTSAGDWVDVSFVYSEFAAVYGTAGFNYLCDGTSFVLGVVRTDQEYRWVLVNPDAQYAIPESWRDQLNRDGRFLASEWTVMERVVAVYPSTSPTNCLGTLSWKVPSPSGDIAVEWRQIVTEKTVCKYVPVTGQLRTPPSGPAAMIGAKCASICNELDPSTANTLTNITPIDTDALILSIPLVGGSPAT